MSDLKKMNPQTEIELDFGLTIYVRPFPWKYMSDALEIFNRYFAVIAGAFERQEQSGTAQIDIQTLIQLLTTSSQDSNLKKDVERLIRLSLHPRTWESDESLKELKWLEDEDFSVVETAVILQNIFSINSDFFNQRLKKAKPQSSETENSKDPESKNGLVFSNDSLQAVTATAKS